MMNRRAAGLMHVHMNDQEDTFRNHLSPEKHTNYTHMGRFVSEAEPFSTYCMYMPHIPPQVPPGALITKAVRAHLPNHQVSHHTHTEKHARCTK